MPAYSKSAIAVWDFTINKDRAECETIKSRCREWGKKWSFQLEEGKEGYLHWQGRISLKSKVRASPDWDDWGCHFSPTSDENKTNTFYVTKMDSRVDGPWSDNDTEVYIPRQFRNLTLRPWQQKVLEDSEIFNDRIINMVVDGGGNKGKSTLAAICELRHGGIDLPPVNDCKELLQAACDICIAKNTRDPKIMFVDLPRAFDKSRLHGIYSAIEQIKKGKLVDLRYSYKEWWIDSPAIWVFSNREPDLSMLSQDRWRVWTFSEQMDLIKYVPNDVVELPEMV